MTIPDGVEFADLCLSRDVDQSLAQQRDHGETWAGDTTHARCWQLPG